MICFCQVSKYMYNCTLNIHYIICMVFRSVIYSGLNYINIYSFWYVLLDLDFDSTRIQVDSYVILICLSCHLCFLTGDSHP